MFRSNIKDDIRSVRQTLDIPDFPYRDTHRETRCREAIQRWPLVQELIQVEKISNIAQESMPNDKEQA